MNQAYNSIDLAGGCTSCNDSIIPSANQSLVKMPEYDTYFGSSFYKSQREKYKLIEKVTSKYEISEDITIHRFSYNLLYWLYEFSEVLRASFDITHISLKQDDEVNSYLIYVYCKSDPVKTFAQLESFNEKYLMDINLKFNKKISIILRLDEL